MVKKAVNKNAAHKTVGKHVNKDVSKHDAVNGNKNLDEQKHDVLDDSMDSDFHDDEPIPVKRDTSIFHVKKDDKDKDEDFDDDVFV